MDTGIIAVRELSCMYYSSINILSVPHACYKYFPIDKSNKKMLIDFP